eukprot:TRINITY_DN2137_c0_g1_i1.p1 TRINITY_DN2137_c0_g1~~TRINITY_DN2137_c0_g1_i1.p1  ORF type:complete len:230 (+),score=48.81 TRINITY_DN2137_c0_g1_i1:85-690(+)
MGVFFMEPIREQCVDTVSSLKDTARNPRQFLQSSIGLLMVVCSALMIWKSLMCVTWSESPIVVVLSGSMEPGFQRGDLLFLSLWDHEPYAAGDVVVFKVDGRDIPIVHRVIRSHRLADDEKNPPDHGKGFYLLTKGDNNGVDDLTLYADGQRWVEKRHLLGKAQGYLPFVGMVTILMNDYPYLKFGIITVLVILGLANRDE